MMENKYIMMHILDVHTASPFKDLFVINPAVLASVTAAMKKRGYDITRPIVIWGGHGGIVVDGHTRLRAAGDAGLLEVAVMTVDFADEDEAVEYAIDAQRNRRNLSAGELMACLKWLDGRKKVGRPEKTATDVAISGRSSDATARLLGISRGKVEKIRSINDHGSDEIKAAVTDGKMTINKAYNETMRELRERKAAAGGAEKSASEVRAERMTAMATSIAELVRKRMEREVQNFPELRYTEAERRKLCEDISASAEKIVAEMLPSETN